MPVTLTIHDSQYPSQVAAQLCDGLRRRKLSSKFLYDSPAQAQRWLTYHQAYSPSRADPELLALYQRAFEAALAARSGTLLHYVSLGCGGGMKDTLFLEQALRHGATLAVTPMDVSVALVVETMLRLRSTLPPLPCRPLVVDLEAQPDLSTWFVPHEPPDSQRLLACFGMLPNFVYTDFLPYVRRLMRPDDLLLLSANLSPRPYPQSCDAIVPQYDNPLARAWFSGLLESLGLPLQDVDLQIDAHPLRPDGQIWQIDATARFRRGFELTLDGETFVFQADDTLEVFFSNRFTPQIMPQILAEAGLVTRETFLLTSAEEGVYLCRPSAEIPPAGDEQVRA